MLFKKWKKINKTRFWFIFTCGHLIISVLAYFLIEIKEVTIFPEDIAQYGIIGYHEEGSETSSYSIVKSNNKLSLNYTLTTSRYDPFTAMLISRKDSSQTLCSLQDLNTLVLKINAAKGKIIPVMLTFDAPDVNDSIKKYKRIAFEDEIKIDGRDEYYLDLRNFKPASWWLRFHGKSETSLSVYDYLELKSIVIGSCKILKGGESDQIDVTGIEFYHNNKRAVLILLFVLFVFNVVLWISFFYPFRKEIFIPIQATEIPPVNKEELEAIKFFIGSRFSNVELNLFHAEEALGLSGKEINTILKQELNSSFNQYLNTVRIIEAKNLLLTSNMAISDISLKCGYKHVTHFNRIFKSETNFSPKDFRNQK